MRETSVPIAVSNRHVHLSEEDARTLFGESHHFSPDPSPERLLWPDQTLWQEKVTLAGPGGTIPRVSILGPLGRTSIEMSCADAYRLGLNSDNVKAKKFLPGVTITGPKGSVFAPTDYPINGRWLLVSKPRADDNGLKDGASVDVRVAAGSDWATTFHNVKVVVSSITNRDIWALYIDPDAASAAAVKTGDTAHVLLG
jgi:putative phosphotransacetylase